MGAGREARGSGCAVEASQRTRNHMAFFFCPAVNLLDCVLEMRIQANMLKVCLRRKLIFSRLWCSCTVSDTARAHRVSAARQEALRDTCQPGQGDAAAQDEVGAAAAASPCIRLVARVARLRLTPFVPAGRQAEGIGGAKVRRVARAHDKHGAVRRGLRQH